MPERRPSPQEQPAGRALVADDEAAIRRLARAVLERLGYQVVEAMDGAQAVAQVTADPSQWRLAVLDLTMPALGGWAAAEQIHAAAPELPIIVMSGFSLDAEQESLRGSVIRGYVRKPFTLDQLRAAVEDVWPPGLA